MGYQDCRSLPRLLLNVCGCGNSKRSHRRYHPCSAFANAVETARELEEKTSLGRSVRFGILVSAASTLQQILR